MRVQLLLLLLLLLLLILLLLLFLNESIIVTEHLILCNVLSAYSPMRTITNRQYSAVVFLINCATPDALQDETSF